MPLIADCVAAIGASGTGKGLFVRERVSPLALAGRRRVFVWSPLESTDRYATVFNGMRVDSIPTLCKLTAGGATRPLIFMPSENDKVMRAQFDLWCRIVWHTVRCVAVVEELSRVTSPAFAPAPWATLSTAGRHRGLTVIATAQRPAMCDKHFLGNCTEIRGFRCNYESDARALASVMREPAQAFTALPDRHYIHRWLRADRPNVHGVQALPFESAYEIKTARRARRGAGR